MKPSKVACLYFGGFFEPDSLKAQIDEISKLSESNDLWNDQERAKTVMKKKAQLEGELGRFQRAEAQFSDLKSMLEMAEEENEPQLIEETEKEIQKLYEYMKIYQLECFFSGEADNNSCYLEVHAISLIISTLASSILIMIIRFFIPRLERLPFPVDSCTLLSDSPNWDNDLR